jgi:hypothetical protein
VFDEFSSVATRDRRKIMYQLQSFTKIIFYLVFHFALASNPNHLFAEEIKPLNQYNNKSADHKTANELIDQLYAATTYDALDAIIGKMRMQTKDVHTHLVIGLVGQLRNVDKLNKFTVDIKSKYSFVYYGIDEKEFDAIFYSKDSDDPKCTKMTCQDIRIKGGRCAWALERLLYLYLPTVITGLKPAQLDEIVKNIHSEVFYAMSLNSDPIIIISKLTTKEKLAYSTAPATHPRLLVDLATDGDLEVKRNLAENKLMPFSVVGRLSKDPDAIVSGNAIRNCHARTFETDTELDWIYWQYSEKIIAEMKHKE